MNPTLTVIIAAVITAAIGLWLLLPRGEQPGRRLGIVLGLVSLGLFASRLPRLGPTTEVVVFWLLAGTTIISAAGAVTLRNPVYCAIWFAMTLLGTAALFLFQGAQFLGVATIVVYAGAILVTFLFVLMLTQPTGQAYYDRLSWEALISATVGAVMIGILTMVIFDAFATPAVASADKTAAAGKSSTAQKSDTDATRQAITDRHTLAARQDNILADRHMERLGAQLFSRHLIAIEVAGTMLLAALVGAVAIAIHSKPLARSAGGARHG